jgi:hypothetical protein
VNSAAVYTDKRQRQIAIGVALDDLVSHANDRARDIVAVEHDLLRCVQLLHALPGLTGPG